MRDIVYPKELWALLESGDCLPKQLEVGFSCLRLPQDLFLASDLIAWVVGLLGLAFAPR